MSCSCSIPKLVATSIEILGTNANITVCGVLPTCGRFDVCLKGCKDSSCSASNITIEDSEGTIITFILDLHANQAMFGAVSVQASRYGVLHLVRSSQFPAVALWLDCVRCVPTPISYAPSPFKPSEFDIEEIVETSKVAKATSKA